MTGNKVHTVKLRYINHTETYVEVEDGSYLSLLYSHPQVPLIELEEGDEFEIDSPEWALENADLEYLIDET